MAIEITARAASAATVTLAQTRTVAARRSKPAPAVRRPLPRPATGPDPTELTSLTPGTKASTDLLILMKTLRADEEVTGPPVTDLGAEIGAETESGISETTVTTESSVTEIRIEQSVEVSLRVRVERHSGAEAPPRGEAPRKDPLVLDLNGNGQIDLTTAAGGRKFDLDADGRDDRAAFVTGGDAFLALDRDGNGRITSGAELFGDQSGAADGFGELARLDANRDGVIDGRDPRFGDLRAFDGDRSRTLAEVGVTSIQLGARRTVTERADGNAEVAQSTFSRANGQLGRVADVLLAYQQMA